MSEINQPRPAPAQRKPSWLTIAIAIFGGTFLLCGGGLGLLFNSAPKPTDEQRADFRAGLDDLAIAQQAERELKTALAQRLKSPEAATYALKTRVVTGQGGRVILIAGTVTSPNSFGAPQTIPVGATLWRGDKDAGNRFAQVEHSGKKIPADRELLAKCQAIIGGNQEP